MPCSLLATSLDEKHRRGSAPSVDEKTKAVRDSLHDLDKGKTTELLKSLLALPEDTLFPSRAADDKVSYKNSCYCLTCFLPFSRPITNLVLVGLCSCRGDVGVVITVWLCQALRETKSRRKQGLQPHGTIPLHFQRLLIQFLRGH